MIDLTFLDDDECGQEKVKSREELILEGDDCEENVASEKKILSELEQHGEWNDPDFPATSKSIRGKDDDDEEEIMKKIPTTCLCGLAPDRAVVKSDTANKGRAYLRCANHRKCGFFTWADGKSSKITPSWQRFHGIQLVTDAGFAASDLKQGRLGSCWFLSALAVVAERHDLIARLFIDTKYNKKGIYGLRFFLDGKWRAVFVDNQLPTYQERPAYCRCYDSTTSRPTLWASLAEKAYAKAHGSFRAISGGQISEALRDLTGAACVCIDLPRDGSFEFFEILWKQFFQWKTNHNFPMGCATSDKTDGLNPSHAYSILAVKQYPQGRLVRIRDPHGFSHFPKCDDLGKQIAKYLLSSNCRLDKHDQALIQDATDPNPQADGTFFMPYHHFAAAFSRVDVCFAWEPGLIYAASLRCRFPKPRATSRVCQAPVLLQNFDQNRPGLIALVALQDSRRGAWCRDDRKKSYTPGDISLIVLSFPDRSRVLASCFQGCEVGNHSVSCIFTLPPRARCMVLCYSLVKNPTAVTGTTRGGGEQPLMLRCTANVKLRLVPGFEKHALNIESTTALHSAILNSGSHTVIERPRSLRTLAPGDRISCKSLLSDGLLILLCSNYRNQAVYLDCVCYCKSAAARISDSGPLLVDDRPAAQQYADNIKSFTPKHAAPSSYKWPAKWKCFRASAIRVPANSQRILMAIACTGVQFHIGDIDVSLSSSTTRDSLQTTLTDSSKFVGLYAPLPIPTTQSQGIDHGLQRALENSKHDQDLQRAIDLSRQEQDSDLQRAIELSKNEQSRRDVIVIDDSPKANRRRPRDLIVIDDDDELPSSKKERKSSFNNNNFLVIDDDDDDES